MASKSSYSAEERGAEIEEALDALDKLVDRLKVLYEQYFMGIQKQAPSHLHNDAERRIRDVAQMQIRNTALRYRFATIQQKYGAYNTYWKRSLREIEAGRYVRNLAKLRRQAMTSGENIPAEIMAAMPKRMRESVERDRALALAEAQRRGKLAPDAVPEERDEPEPDTEPTVARIVAPPPPRRTARFTTDPFEHAKDEDVATALAGLADEALAALETPKAAPAPAPAPKAAPAPTAASTTIAAPAPKPAGRRPTRPPPIAFKPPAIPSLKTPKPPAPAAPAPAPAAAAAPARPPVPGMTEAETRALYAKYVKAREVVGDKTEGLTYDKLVRTLSTQAPKILEQHKAKGVEFNVVIRDNKVVLKAKPR